MTTILQNKYMIASSPLSPPSNPFPCRSPSDRHPPRPRIRPRPGHSSRGLPAGRQERVRLLPPAPLPPRFQRLCPRDCGGYQGAGAGAGWGAGCVHAGVLWVSLAARGDAAGPGGGVQQGWVGM